MLVKESILNTIRENIPIEEILRVYLDESEEQETVEELIHPKKDATNQSVASGPDSESAIQATSSTVNDQNDDGNKTLQEKLDDMANKINNKFDDVDALDEDSGVNDESSGVNDDSGVNDESSGQDNQEEKSNKLTIDFSNVDKSINSLGLPEDIIAPKDINTLEQKRKENENNDMLEIGDNIDIDIDGIELGDLDNSENVILDDIEEL